MKIRHDTFIVERFPIYQDLLRRDIRAHRIATTIRWGFYAAAFLGGAWLAGSA